MIPTHSLPVSIALQSLPPVPSTVPIYKSTVTTTTNEDTSTFSSVDIGVPHPKRIVILAYYCGVAAAATGTVNGNDTFQRMQNAAQEFGIMGFQVPNGTLAEITLTAAASIRKAVSVYIAYPHHHRAQDSGNDSQTTTTDANVAGKKVIAKGFIIYAGGQHATLGAFTTTVAAPADAVTENVDAQLEAAASYTMGMVPSVSVSSDTCSLNLAETASGTKRVAMSCWGPAYGNW